MGLFNKLFGESDNKDTSSSRINWNALTSLQQLDDIIQESAEMPVIIFKHSTRCGISRMALSGFEKEYAIDTESAKPYFLDLLQHRDISNEIATIFHVQHQSPQILIIKDGVVVYHASHGDIDAGKVGEMV
ncbi:bacillithiol system redox-active protein YtxJ [Flavobacterium sp. MFBS3-15]|uniref:bacillithiol system redox-active protein YtxJ n=1 Tax=Flavobacterium sp. MFBS3-15 TaxID=2989816 RepID=UPI0022364D02|nr:bacillithiol system redox-active protein YtxJ [Flavobacterium sp. MFBS3-15]MCW4469613.1 bacillithiol system redox-active protein YtxJ [Flavobacterium sp. MFBS3-15]